MTWQIVKGHKPLLGAHHLGSPYLTSPHLTSPHLGSAHSTSHKLSVRDDQDNGGSCEVEKREDVTRESVKRERESERERERVEHDPSW
ncbi:unnamed protein product [Taenia asiatica]|uniref:Uncharacterized protein n=1 Tax=Taenia asiatica TaxID=60517 RepID=A0A0R3VYR7_TAEAS|nr:unnamed protein product [Taenia asiatica]